MKYSVLMSVYKNDNPNFLKLALNSIYEAQTRKPDEIVVVFDGPLNEGLYKILNEFRNGKEDIVKYYQQEKNKGLGEALRIGSEKCNGDYIFRMDSDDISVDDRFEKQIAYIETHPDIDVVGGNIEEFKESINEKKLRKRVYFMNHNDIVKMSKHRNPMNHVTVAIKKESLFKAGGYLPLSYVEDYYLWIRMINKGFKLANLEDALVYVRIGNGFTTRRGYKAQIESWDILQKYMVVNNMITKKEANKNMIYIKLFVNMPAWIKKILYSTILRRK